MKFVAILCSFVLFALVSPAAVPIPEKHHEMAKALLKECQTAEGGSDSDYNVMITGEFSDTKEGHCMMTCVNEKIGNVSRVIYHPGKTFPLKNFCSIDQGWKV